MIKEQKLISTQDNSVNFVLANGLECRFVQRSQEYFIIYLSSQTGCAKACRFCHLTQTGQTLDNNATHEDYVNQALLVIKHWRDTYYDERNKLIKVHVNFMARGEPLNNPVLMHCYKDLFDELSFYIEKYVGVKDVRFKISTIVPTDVDQDALLAIDDPRAEFYYSLYSTNANFRRQWLPKALLYPVALRLLSNKKKVTIHHSLIRDKNDSLQEAENIAMACLRIKHKPNLNLVKYNPYSKAQGEESPQKTVEAYANYMRMYGGFGRVKIIKRVGPDVFASCGMFVERPIKVNLIKQVNNHD